MNSNSFPKPASRRSPRHDSENTAFSDERKPRPQKSSRSGSGKGQSSKRSAYTERKHTSENPTYKPHSNRATGRDKSFPQPKKSSEAPLQPERERNHDEEQETSSLLPGLKPVLELLENAPERVDCVFLRKGRHSREMDHIVDLCRQAGVRFSLLAPEAFSRVYQGKSQGVAARLYPKGFVDLETLLESAVDAPLPLIVFLDQVQDPGNAGTLARTLYALGGAGIVIPKHNGVYLGAAAGKAAAGALEYLPVAKAANLGQALDAAAKMGYRIYGASGLHAETRPTAPSESTGKKDTPSEETAVDVFSITPRFPAILVLGGEEGGLRPGVRKRCHTEVGIPMLRDFDSLNVAQAGAIIISWFSRNAPTPKR